MEDDGKSTYQQYEIDFIATKMTRVIFCKLSIGSDGIFQ